MKTKRHKLDTGTGEKQTDWGTSSTETRDKTNMKIRQINMDCGSQR